MKTLAIFLCTSCILDIIIPTIRVVKGYRAVNGNIPKGSLNEFVRSEVLNICAVVFFVTFIFRY